jgi:hypothetical protein
MDAIDNSLDDVIMKDRQDKKQQQKQTRDGKRSQGINKRSGPIRNTSSGRGGAHRKSPTVCPIFLDSLTRAAQS